jgi:hypothetical protein
MNQHELFRDFPQSLRISNIATGRNTMIIRLTSAAALTPGKIHAHCVGGLMGSKAYLDGKFPMTLFIT